MSLEHCSVMHDINEYYIGISISELQQWLVDEELSVLKDRIVHSRVSLTKNSSFHDLLTLFKSLPVFAVDDQAGVLIVEISPSNTWVVDNDPRICHVSLSGVK